MNFNTIASWNIISRWIIYFIIASPWIGVLVIANNMMPGQGTAYGSQLVPFAFMLLYLPIEFIFIKWRKKYGLGLFKSYRKIVKQKNIDFKNGNFTANSMKLNGEDEKPENLSKIEKYDDLWHEMRDNHITLHRFQKEAKAIFN